MPPKLKFESTDDAGYESETGARDNPTCAHFVNNTPVEKVAPQYIRMRPICRIVKPHGWSIAKTAAIFGIGVNTVLRALTNSYVPSDNVEKDYEYVGEDFKIRYPPIQKAGGSDAQVQVMKPPVELIDITRDSSDDEEPAPRAPPPSRALLMAHRAAVAKAQDASGTAALLVPVPPSVPHGRPKSAMHPRPAATAPAAQPIPAPAPPPAATLRSFLSSVMNMDLSAHHALLVRQGFTLPGLRAMSTWPAHDLAKVLGKLLRAEDGEGQDDRDVREGLTPLLLEALGPEIRKLGA
ncbi:hypothetical protein C8J57DRAFT_1723004 [Mycena rebaudengoi]|nr:hypothetical protein C8J57DRAFT_1723004 [Mycena rebaudengoi]